MTLSLNTVNKVEVCMYVCVSVDVLKNTAKVLIVSIHCTHNMYIFIQVSQ